MLQTQNKTHPLSGFQPEHGKPKSRHKKDATRNFHAAFRYQSEPERVLDCVSRAPEKITERARKLQYVRPNRAIRQILGRPGYL